MCLVFRLRSLRSLNALISWVKLQDYMECDIEQTYFTRNSWFSGCLGTSHRITLDLMITKFPSSYSVLCQVSLTETRPSTPSILGGRGSLQFYLLPKHSTHILPSKFQSSPTHARAHIHTHTHHTTHAHTLGLCLSVCHSLRIPGEIDY